MKRSFKTILAVLSAAMLSGLLLGCGHSAQTPVMPACRVVTAVTVTYEHGPIRMQRHYTSAPKMQQVLDYLRLLRPYGRPDRDPLSVSGSSFDILLTYSDGFRERYRQKADRYLQGIDGQWRRIDPNKAKELSRILGQTQSDL